MKVNLSTNLSPKRSGQDLSENKQNPQPANERFAAFVIGGTGAVGANLVNKLITSPLYSRVTVISRREPPLPPSTMLWSGTILPKH